MRTGLRVAGLFVAYALVGFGGEYAVSLLAQDDGRGEAVVVQLDTQIEPEVVVDVRIRNSGECRFELDRELTIPISSAELLSIDAASGELRVEGRQGLDEIVVVGRVCASHEEYIDALQLEVDRSGDQIVLSAHYPDRRGFGGRDDTARIDLMVAMPLGFNVDIDDSSGSIEVEGSGDLWIDDSSGSIQVSGANGSVWIDDSSGGIEVDDVSGDVEIEDGSGGIDVRDVQGTVRLRDGSGAIDVAEVDQSVVVESDGSGSIDVRGVGGDFIVERDSSGGVRYSDVSGQVDVPIDERRRRRGN